MLTDIIKGLTNVLVVAVSLGIVITAVVELKLTPVVYWSVSKGKCVSAYSNEDRHREVSCESVKDRTVHKLLVP